MKRITIKDIAEHLTISVSTVSRALSDDKNIRNETKEKVLEAARLLGYKPNPVATNLKFGRTNTVGVIVPEMVTPYAALVIKGIQEILNQQNIKVIIADSNESWQQERENLATMERFMVDGILISTCDYKANMDEYMRIQEAGIPIVFFDRIPYQMSVSQVLVDDYIKSFFLVEHLIRSGHKRIVHLHGPNYVHNSVERARGYRDALSKFKIPYDKELEIISGLHFEDGATAIEQLEQKGIAYDALFAFTDTLAIGAMNRLREIGKQIPHDVAVAGFSGTVLSTIVFPQLTTIEPPLQQMGAEAARLIVEKIKDPFSPTRSIVLDAQIALRASTEKE